MHHILELILDYVKLALIWCRANPKYVSTFILVVVTVISLIIGFTIDIPNQTTTKVQSKNTLKTVDFQVNTTQLEWIAKNCEFFCCIEETCYCLTHREVSWSENSQSCHKESTLPNAKLISPLKIKEKGVFHTYQNLLSFLSYSSNYHQPIWSGLSRQNPNEDFRNEAGKSFSWFNYHKLEAEESIRRGAKCVQKISSKGWDLRDCAQTDTFPLPSELENDILKDESNFEFLQWSEDQRYVTVKAAILCQIKYSEHSDNPTTQEFITNNTGSLFIEGSDGDTFYHKYRSFHFWGNRQTDLCYQALEADQIPMKRVVISSKAQEDDILNNIPGIFLEIGIDVEEQKGKETLKWDQDRNGIQMEQLKWYFDDKTRNGQNCMSTESYSDKNLKLSWTAQSCKRPLYSVCTFTPPKQTNKKDIAMQFHKEDGPIENQIDSYFCIDQERTKCYATLKMDFASIPIFLRENKLRVAVVNNEEDKKAISEKLRPMKCAYVGASSMLRGAGKFYWMYDQGEVKFTQREKRELFGQGGANPELICLVLGSHGRFYAERCDKSFSTLVEIRTEDDIQIIKKKVT